MIAKLLDKMAIIPDINVIHYFATTYSDPKQGNNPLAICVFFFILHIDAEQVKMYEEHQLHFFSAYFTFL